jgi:hypothetical protein
MARLLFAFGVTIAVVSAAAVLAFLYRHLFGHRIWIKFLRRTGYRRREDPLAPVEAQARAVLDEIVRPEGIVRGPWVRDVDGQTLTYEAWTYQEDGATMTQESWALEMPVAVPSHAQVVERKLAPAAQAAGHPQAPGLRETLGAAALGRERRWSQLLPVALATGDPAFDARFLVLVERGASLPLFLRHDGLLRYLAALPEVYLVVFQKWITLDDPAGALRRHHVGPGALTPAQAMEREPAAHDQVAQTLAIVSRAIRGV